MEWSTRKKKKKEKKKKGKAMDDEMMLDKLINDFFFADRVLKPDISDIGWVFRPNVTDVGWVKFVLVSG